MTVSAMVRASLVAQVDLVLGGGDLVVASTPPGCPSSRASGPCRGAGRRPRPAASGRSSRRRPGSRCSSAVGEVEELELRADVEGVAHVRRLLEDALERIARIARRTARRRAAARRRTCAPRRCSRGRQGRIRKVSGSGKAIMSDSSMRVKPSMDEPSKPMPSSNALSSSESVDGERLEEPEHVGEPEPDEVDVALLDALEDEVLVELGCHAQALLLPHDCGDTRHGRSQTVAADIALVKATLLSVVFRTRYTSHVPAGR